MARAFSDNSIGAHAVDVQCRKCKRSIHLHQALIDIDGPAFAAYYCVPCFPWPEGSDHVLTGKAEGGVTSWFAEEEQPLVGCGFCCGDISAKAHEPNCASRPSGVTTPKVGFGVRRGGYYEI